MSKKGGIFKGLIITVLIAFPIAFVSLVAVFWFVLDSAPENTSAAMVELLIRHGDTIADVSQRLEDEGLVRNRAYIELRYKILYRLGRMQGLQAGRYTISNDWKPSKILKALTSESAEYRIYVDLVIPPGLTSRAIAKRVQEAGLAREEDALDAIITLAVDYPIQKNPEGLQGYLFPDTYRIEAPLEENPDSSKQLAQMIVHLMARRFFEVQDEIYPAWRQLTRTQLHEKVTLASIVEREYRRPEEAATIAAVFNNRLIRNMRLQSCATVVYTIENTSNGRPFQNDYYRFNRRIFERYLDIESPYNTYQSGGLPPGPIASPGPVALNAAFFPSDTDVLYFVVKDPVAGTHTFTRVYNDHLDARDEYFLSQYIVKN